MSSSPKVLEWTPFQSRLTTSAFSLLPDTASSKHHHDIQNIFGEVSYLLEVVCSIASLGRPGEKGAVICGWGELWCANFIHARRQRNVLHIPANSFSILHWATSWVTPTILGRTFWSHKNTYSVARGPFEALRMKSTAYLLRLLVPSVRVRENGSTSNE